MKHFRTTLTLTISLILTATLHGAPSANGNGPSSALEHSAVFSLLQNQINDLYARVTTLEERADVTDAKLIELKRELRRLEQEMRNGDSRLQSQIDETRILIAYLQAELVRINTILASKQDIVSGNCPAGYAIREIRRDGSVVCESTGPSGLSQQIVRYAGRINGACLLQSCTPEDHDDVTLSCSSGYRVSGAGFTYNSAWMDLASSEPVSTNSWRMVMTIAPIMWLSGADYTLSITCLKLY